MIELTTEEVETIAMCLQFCVEHHAEVSKVFDSPQEASRAGELAERLLREIDPLVQ